MTNVNDVYLISLLVEAWISRVPGAGSAEGASSPSQPGAPLQGAAPEPKKRDFSPPGSVFTCPFDACMCPHCWAAGHIVIH